MTANYLLKDGSNVLVKDIFDLDNDLKLYYGCNKGLIVSMNGMSSVITSKDLSHGK